MIIRRYVWREILQAFGGVIAVLLLVYVSNRFVKFLAEAAAGEMSAGVIFELVALKLAENISLLLPLALYVAVLLGLGRLYRDSEVIALAAGGSGVSRLASVVSVIGLAGAVLVGTLSLAVAPGMSLAADELNQRARDSTEIAGVYPGQFKEYGDGDQVFYVEGLGDDRRRLENVFIQVRGDSAIDVLLASRGRYVVDNATGQRYLVLEDGYRYRGTPGNADYVETFYTRHGVLIEDGEQDERPRKLESISTAELMGSNRPKYRAEFHWRLALPIATFVLALLAVPLSRSAPGSGRFARLFVGLLAYFIYFNALGIARKVIESPDIPSGIGLWPVHLVMMLIVLVLLRGQSRVGGPLPRWMRRPRAALDPAS
ncbi:MAG: LPS export ABC transporter permease LptF [Pseudomonadota bacterium]